MEQIVQYRGSKSTPHSILGSPLEYFFNFAMILCRLYYCPCTRPCASSCHVVVCHTRDTVNVLYTSSLHHTCKGMVQSTRKTNLTVPPVLSYYFLTQIRSGLVMMLTLNRPNEHAKVTAKHRLTTKRGRRQTATLWCLRQHRQQGMDAGLHAVRVTQQSSTIRAVPGACRVVLLYILCTTDRQTVQTTVPARQRGNNTCCADGLIPHFKMLRLKFEVCNSMCQRRLRTGEVKLYQDVHQRTLHFKATRWVLVTKLLYCLVLCLPVLADSVLRYDSAQIGTILCCFLLSMSMYSYNTPR